jgi:hypothetical protein
MGILSHPAPVRAQQDHDPVPEALAWYLTPSRAPSDYTGERTQGRKEVLIQFSGYRRASVGKRMLLKITELLWISY